MSERQLTPSEERIVDDYRRRMESAKTPKERARLAYELGRELDLPDPENFVS